jgi:zinc protease
VSRAYFIRPFAMAILALAVSNCTSGRRQVNSADSAQEIAKSDMSSKVNSLDTAKGQSKDPSMASATELTKAQSLELKNAVKDDQPSPVVQVRTSAEQGFTLKPFVEKELANGLKILYVKDETLPSFSVSMMIKSGSSSDPLGQSGIARATADLLSKGTLEKDSKKLSVALAELGASLSTSANDDYTMIDIDGLSFHAKDLSHLLEEVLFKPRFAADEISRLQKQYAAVIRSRSDDADSFADYAFRDYLFGDHPYGRSSMGRLATLKELKKKNIIQFFKRHYRPNNAVLSMTGRFTSADEERIEKLFGKWERRSVAKPAFPKVDISNGLKIRLYDNPSLVQAQIRIGHEGIPRSSEDFLTLRVANTILGGAFKSRLNDRVRKELGLTYGVSSAFEAKEASGPFYITTFTKNKSVGQAVKEVISLFAQFKKEGVTSEEVARTKGYLSGRFPASIETDERLAENLMVLRRYGISDQYLGKYIENLGRISVSDVNRAIQKYFDPENLKILVYGNAKEISDQLVSISGIEQKKAKDLN